MNNPLEADFYCAVVRMNFNKLMVGYKTRVQLCDNRCCVMAGIESKGRYQAFVFDTFSCPVGQIEDAIASPCKQLQIMHSEQS